LDGVPLQKFVSKEHNVFPSIAERQQPDGDNRETKI
jgi:hypothetical protein